MKKLRYCASIVGAGFLACGFPGSAEDQAPPSGQPSQMTPQQMQQYQSATQRPAPGAATSRKPGSAPQRPGGVPQLPGGMQGTQKFGTAQTTAEPMDQVLCAQLQMPVSLAPAGADAAPDALPAIRFESYILKAAYIARTAGKGQEDPQKIEVLLQRGLTAKRAAEKVQKCQGRELEYSIYRLKVDWGRKDLAAVDEVFAACGEGITSAALQKKIDRYVKTVLREDFRFSKLDLHPEVTVKLEEDVKAGWKGESVEEKTRAKLNELRKKMGKDPLPSAAEAQAGKKGPTQTARNPAQTARPADPAEMRAKLDELLGNMGKGPLPDKAGAGKAEQGR